jgi:CBS domain-containing protein
MRVADLMTTDVASCRTSEPSSTACEIMWDCDCGLVPVLADDSDEVVGVVTDRDICMACWSRGLAPQSLYVADAMSKTLRSCSPGDSVAKAEAIMRTNQIRRLPVIEHGRLVGILSLADIAREAGRGGARRDRDLAPDEITSTLSGIVQPSSPARAH